MKRELTPEREGYLLKRIIDRGLDLAQEYGAVQYLEQSRAVDGYIRGCHLFCAKLQLQQLLDAPDPDFAHDFFGILTHFDVGTSSLRDCFVPRYAVQEATA